MSIKPTCIQAAKKAHRRIFFLLFFFFLFQCMCLNLWTTQKDLLFLSGRHHLLWGTGRGDDTAQPHHDIMFACPKTQSVAIIFESRL